MWDLVGNPEDRFSDVAAHISGGDKTCPLFDKCLFNRINKVALGAKWHETQEKSFTPIIIWAVTQENQSSGFRTRSDTNQAVQVQKMVRVWKFWLKNRKRRDPTIQVAKTKVLISFAVTTKLICAFVFAYAKCWFSCDAAHIVFSVVQLGWKRGSKRKKNMFPYLKDLDYWSHRK